MSTDVSTVPSQLRSTVEATTTMVMQRANTMAREQDPGSEEVELLILTNVGQLYAPEKISRCDVVIGGSQIVGLPSNTASLQALPGVCVLDVGGDLVCPGFVDNHVHVTGGGGEAGPESKCPEAQLSQLVDAGITTLVGLLGTDSCTRTQCQRGCLILGNMLKESLVAKVAALNADGLTAYHWVGGYRVPVRTVTGDIQKELMAITSCIGVGEIAVGDHRSSAPTAQELARIAMDTRVGGMLSGKAGLVCCHMGTAPNRMQLVRDLVASGVPITQLLLTHMERAALPPPKAGAQAAVSKDSDEEDAQENGEDDAQAWLEAGGNVDYTAGKHAIDALNRVLKNGNNLGKCTVSSDAFGSYPEFDSQGRLVKYRVRDRPIAVNLQFKHMACVGHSQEMSLPTTMLHLVRTLHKKEGWPLEQALRLVTRNPARLLNLTNKGRVKVGCDADLLVLDKSTLDIKYVICQGRLLRTPTWTQGNMMEKGERIKHFRNSAGNRDRLGAIAKAVSGGAGSPTT